MSKDLSAPARNAKPSATITLNAEAKNMKAKGLNVISFAVGEPDFDTPENIKAAAAEAMRRGETKYTPTPGIPELREAICAKFRRDNGLTYAPAQVMVSNGGKQALHMTAMTLIDDGDEAIIPAPYWVSYPAQIRFNGGVPVIVQTAEENDFIPSAEAIEAAITPRTKLLILCSPSNPTGAVCTEQQLREIIAVAVKHDLWVVSDEIYEKLVYDDARAVSPASFSPGAYEHVITCNGVSKTYAMTGWRIGYIAGPEDVVKKAGMLQSHVSSGPNTIAQWAAVEALNGDQSKVEEFREKFDHRRKMIVELLNGVPGVSCRTPKGAFYAFPNVKGLLGRGYHGQEVSDSLRLSQLLLEHAHIAVTPGSVFGAEGYLRFSYALSEDEIADGVGRFAEFVKAGAG